MIKEENPHYERVERLADIFLGERIPLDIYDAATGFILIPANRKITKILLLRVSKAREPICDPSPCNNKLQEILAKYPVK